MSVPFLPCAPCRQVALLYGAAILCDECAARALATPEMQRAIAEDDAKILRDAGLRT